MQVRDMKAAYIEKAGQPLLIKSLKIPSPGDNEVLIRIEFAALNHRDLWILKGQYAGRKEQIIPGSDGAGIVMATGRNVSSYWQGKKVIIYPGIGWGSEPSVQSDTFHILGNPTDGTLAEYLIVPADNLFELPAHLSAKQGAAVPLSGLTAYRACFTRGGLKAEDTVLITGIGGGTVQFAFQFALAAGARVFVTSGSMQKLEQAVSMGAEGGALYTSPDWAETIKDAAGGIDLVIDSAAGAGFGKLPAIMNPGGRIVNFGQTAGAIGELPARYLFWKQLSILGTTMGSRDDFAAMLEFYSRHRLEPVIDKVFPLDEAAAAFRYMDEAKQFGKILVKVSPD